MGEQTAGGGRPAGTVAGNGTSRLRRVVPGRRDLAVLLLGIGLMSTLAMNAAAPADVTVPVRIHPKFLAGGPAATSLGSSGGRAHNATSSPAPPTAIAARESVSSRRVPHAAACPTPPRGVRSAAPGRGKTVALTFDDGPSPYTAGVLDALARGHVHATFFVIGQQVRARAATLARVVRAGHLVADHSWDHSYPSRANGGWSHAYLARSMARTDTAIVRATGQQPCWFRPPGGFLPRTVLPAAHARRMGVVLWSVDTRDWAVETVAHPSAARRRAMTASIVRGALAGLRQRHPIVLMHDGGGYRGATVQAIPAIIARFRAAGYTFVRLDGRR